MSASTIVVINCTKLRITLYHLLDTRTGRLWMVQWSLDYDHRFETVLSDKKWSEVLNREEKNGRYELYSTTNIFNFLMLDTYNGDTFQVQWSFDGLDNGVWIIGINREED